MPIKLVVALCAALLCSSAQAALILIDFENADRTSAYADQNLNGMRFSSWCAAYITTDRFRSGSTYMAVDAGNNCGRPPNPNYLGDPNGPIVDLWMDRAGNDFSFLGFDTVTPFMSGFGFELKSSKGGYASYSGNEGRYGLGGDTWQDIQWVTFRVTDGGQHQRNRGWDNLRIDVRELPEPATALLVGLAGLGLWAVRRRRIG